MVFVPCPADGQGRAKRFMATCSDSGRGPKEMFWVRIIDNAGEEKRTVVVVDIPKARTGWRPGLCADDGAGAAVTRAIDETILP